MPQKATVLIATYRYATIQVCRGAERTDTAPASLTVEFWHPMTVIAGFVCPHYGSLVADSRLSAQSIKGGVYDVCLKLFPLDGFGALAWAGSLKAIPAVHRGIVRRAMQRNSSGEWLLDRRAVEDALEKVQLLRSGLRVEVLVLGRFAGHVRVNRTSVRERVAMVRIETSPFLHEVIDAGMVVLGSGKSVEDALFGEDLFTQWHRASSERTREEIAMKVFLPASRLASALDHTEPTVGGLYQLGQVIVGEKFAYTPYERWFEPQPGKGIPVRFNWDTSAGQLVQECRALGLRVPLLHPVLESGKLQRSFTASVDIRRMLAADAPQLQPTSNPLKEYCLLDDQGNATSFGLYRRAGKGETPASGV